MDDATHDTTTKASRPLLDGQLRLLEARKGDVEALVGRGGGADDEAAADALLNDLAGVRLVLRAVLLGGAGPAGLPQEERRGLEGFEREARELFRKAAELAGARCLPP